MISCVVFGGGLFGLVTAFSPFVSLVVVFSTETCGLALGRCYRPRSPLVPLVYIFHRPLGLV